MKLRLLCLAGTVALLGACATAPKPLQGTFTPVTPQDAVANTAQVGAQVRWGGRIIETTPGPDKTCFQLVSRPLTGTGRPSSDSPDATQGRFLACRAGFYDPAVFEPGRDVTFVGRVEGYEVTRIGEYDARLPKLAADVVYLWPVVREVEVVGSPWYDPWYGPYWGPRWGYWGWW